MALDPDADWESDTLFLPGVEPASLDVAAPSAGWDALATLGRPVSVPGTVEGLFWDELGGDYVGVSHWSRSFEVPQLLDGQRAMLCFEAVRLRAEVFVDRKLVGYDAVGNTPFEVDISDACQLPGSHELVVRVTDPGGNFDWRDYDAHRWGTLPDAQTLPASHGFGGVSGPVRLELRDALHLSDVFVANTPSLKEVLVTIAYGGPEAPKPGDVAPDLRLQLGAVASGPQSRRGAGWDGELLVDQWVTGGVVEQGLDGACLRVRLSVPEARPWSPSSPQLYRCRASLGESPASALDSSDSGDALSVRFGFRWFEATGIGEDAVLRLNGQRTVLRSAISWGFWPVTGLVPTPELAVRQVRAAQNLGLNMLNHHRTIAAPGLLDVHDELGLLAYEEPGGYWAQGGDDFCAALAREKWLRMIRRDRNHPSVVIFNMINESKVLPEGRFERDLLDAQRLDPTRILTYTSAWAEEDDPALGLHARPGQQGLHASGWWDQHNAPGPGTDRDEHWNGPEDYLRRSENRRDVVFWGEEGAIATQPRLALIAAEVEREHPGWDGSAYLEWKAAYDDYFTEKGWEEFFPDLDSLTRSLGDIAYTYQATAITNIRLGDVADGYVVNGWEGSRFENHSGIVDSWRHPKGHVELLAEANAPVSLQLKLRQRVVHVGTDHGAGVVSPSVVLADVGLINERGLRGPHELRLTVRDSSGAAQRSTTRAVTVSGGDVFGEVLERGLRVLVDGGPGMYTVHAELWPVGGGAGAVVTGQSELLLVDWRGRPVPEDGALVSTAGPLGYFLNVAHGAEVPEFHDGLPPLRWIATDHLEPEPKLLVPGEYLRSPEGELGLKGAYYDGAAFQQFEQERTDAELHFLFSDEGPFPALGGTDFSVRWTGSLVPPETGVYRFHTESSGGVRLWVDGRLVLEEWSEHSPQQDSSEALSLVQGQAVSLRLDFFQEDDNARVRLLWTPPEASARGRALVEEFGRRVAEDGTTLLVLDHATSWARLLADAGLIEWAGVLPMGRYWLGGNYFVREHPLFKDLPVNGGMSWPYQELVHYGMPGFGLRLQGEEAVAACITGHTPELATSVGVVRHGRGRIVLSTLDLPRAIPGPAGPHDVPKALLMNFLEYAVSEH